MNFRAGIFGADAVEAPHKTITEFNEQSSKHTREVVELTKQLKWLTVAMLVLVVVQILLAIVQIVIAVRAGA